MMLRAIECDHPDCDRLFVGTPQEDAAATTGATRVQARGYGWLYKVRGDAFDIDSVRLDLCPDHTTWNGDKDSEP